MAFGFLKKKIFADTIYMNGHIYTQDPEFSWASAVACKDGQILAVGDFEAMEEIVSDDTQVIDLKEKYMFPGFIDVHGTPVLKAFSKHFLQIDPCWAIEPVLDLLEDYVEETDGEIIFGYGFNEKILDFSSAEEAHRVLDEIEAERPVVLLSVTGVHCWVNTVAAHIIGDAAEEDNLEHLTTSYIMNVLAPFTLEEVQSSVREFSEDMADRGFTSIFNACAPDYFSELYLDALFAAIGEGEGDIMQRFHGSIFINRPFHPQLILHRLSAARTNCLELNNLITANFMKLELQETGEPSDFSQEALNSICLEAAEHGFNIHLDALDWEAYEKAVSSFTLLRDKGYKNTTLVLGSSYEPSSDDKDVFLSTWASDYTNDSFFDHVSSVSEAIDALTVTAAELLGMSNELGTIEKGKKADFTVFEENPFDSSVKRFSGMHADMTIVDGLVVYDAVEAAADEMCDILFSMQL